MNRTFRFLGVLLWLGVAMTIGYFYGRDGGRTQLIPKSLTPDGDYTCSMHPFIVKNQPGNCPICAMELVKKGTWNGISDRELLNVTHVALSPTQQVMANLATSAVALQPFSREIGCTGIVAYNQERQGKVSAWLGGRLDRLLVKSVGSQVHKGMPVAEIYSVDLYNAQVQYLLAYKTIKILNSSISVTFPINTHMSLGDAYERLRQLGFREEQFTRLQKSATPSVRVPIYSPFSGVVTEKLVQEGQYVSIGDALFSIADLSRIWVELELFESDVRLVKPGQDVDIVSPSYPGETFHGKVKLIYPFLDAKTRTVKLRVELPNAGLKLKPDMFVKATIKVPLADAMVVPVGAVVDTGKRQVVWIESKPGIFQQREVKTGLRSELGVQILSGLKPGERIATSGSYLIDSEAQLSHFSTVAPAAPTTQTSGTVMNATEKPAHNNR